MDFSSVKGVTIPEGSVTKILDSAGNVLWEKKSTIKTCLEDYTWAEIQAIGAAGEGAQYFNIGDTKTITLNGQIGDDLTLDNYKCKVFILKIYHKMKKLTIILERKFRTSAL